MDWLVCLSVTVITPGTWQQSESIYDIYDTLTRTCQRQHPPDKEKPRGIFINVLLLNIHGTLTLKLQKLYEKFEKKNLHYYIILLTILIFLIFNM